ncbi:MAG: hypothetical protein L0Z53_00800 [Acidobacteriales bacterium]|nr:hypothetical protein [Terriglobales bacterium]
MKHDPGLWNIAPPEKKPDAATAGLDKEEADFVSKYLGLADELLRTGQDGEPADAQKPATDNIPSPDKAA